MVSPDEFFAQLVSPQGVASRMLKLTDEQWVSIYRYFGANQIPIDGKREQLGLFSSPPGDEGKGFR